MEGLDEDGGLDGHVEGAGDAGAVEGFLGTELLSKLHKSWHFDFSQLDFFSSPFVK